MVKFYLLLLNICPWDRARKVRWCKCFYLTHQRSCLTAVELKGKFPVKLQMFNGKICTLWTRSNFYLMFLLWNQWWRCYWFQEPLLRNFSLLEVPGGNLREWNFACSILGAFYLYTMTLWIAQELGLGCKLEDIHSRASRRGKTASSHCSIPQGTPPPPASPHRRPSRGIDRLATVTFLFGSDCPRRPSFSLPLFLSFLNPVAFSLTSRINWSGKSLMVVSVLKHRLKTTFNRIAWGVY